MNQDIKLKRGSTIYTSYSSAIEALNGVTHKVGQPVLVYYKDSSEATEVKTLLVVGKKEGTGSDKYSIPNPEIFNATNPGLAPAASAANKANAESAVGNYYLCADGIYRKLPANAFNDTTYKLGVNGSTNGDSTSGESLGTIYAPTTEGTARQVLLSSGSGEPEWNTGEIIRSILNGTGTAAVTTSPYNYSKWEATDSEITTLYDGLTILYKVPVAGNGTYGTCLRINSLGYHPVVTAVNSMISTRYAVGSCIILCYDSTKSGTVYSNSASSSTISGVWRVVNDYDSGNSNTVPSAYCETAAATAAKTATCTNYSLLSNSYIPVLIRYSNTSKSALTLNINGKGAKSIYINGSASSSSNYTLPAGSYLVFYNGTNYYFRTDGKITGSITGDSATVNGKTVESNVPSDAVFTDRYVNSAAFADDTTNNSSSPVKMTLTRAGSDTSTVTANLPKVSSSSAGVVPKGSAVSSQSTSTKFLREDGTWSAPSYSTYCANLTLATSANYITQPEFKSVKVNGSSTDAASTNNCELQYDTTNKCLKFIFN